MLRTTTASRPKLLNLLHRGDLRALEQSALLGDQTDDRSVVGTQETSRTSPTRNPSSYATFGLPITVLPLRIVAPPQIPGATNSRYAVTAIHNQQYDDSDEDQASSVAIRLAGARWCPPVPVGFLLGPPTVSVG